MNTDGKIILQFRNGQLVQILPDADSDEQAKALLRQLEQAAMCGDLSGLTDSSTAG